jgi:HlyD family secretion protein
MKRTGHVLSALVATLAVVLAYVFWFHDDRGVVVAESPQAHSLPEDDPGVIFSAPGVTEPRSRAIEIFSEVSGTIRAMHVSAGDHVSKGQLLAEIANDIQKASVDLAKATLGKAQADLDHVRKGARPEERAIARAQYDEATAALHQAEFEHRRIQAMVTQQATSSKEVVDSRSLLDLARARCDAAKERWEMSEAGPLPEEVRHAEAAVSEAQAQLDAAGAVLDKTLIRSPIDGIVIYRYREPGEAVFTDKPLPILTIGDRSRLHIRADVDEFDIAKVRIGQRVYATAPAFDGRRFTGQVVHIEPTLGPKNFRTHRPTEKLDTKIQEVVVALDDADEVPIELQMAVWFTKRVAEIAPETSPSR